MRLAFFGSDLFSYPSLLTLHAMSNVQLVLATRILKPSGRGQKKIILPDVVKYAQKHQIPWLEVDHQRDFDKLSSDFSPQLAVAVSYGRRIPASFIHTTQYGGLNVHPSLLPQYRGAAPLQRAIMDLRPYTGVSVQTLHPDKIDHGRLLWQERVTLGRITTPQLAEQLSELGARGLKTVVEKELYKELALDLQSPETPSDAPKINPRESRILFHQTAAKTDAIGRSIGKLWFEQKMAHPRNSRVVRVNLMDFVPVTLQDDSRPGTLTPIGAGKDMLVGIKVADGYVGAQTVVVEGMSKEPAYHYFEKMQARKLDRMYI